MKKNAFYSSLIIFIVLFSIPVLAASPYGQIMGTVTDAETGEKIIGANIIVRNTILGASSDINGKYVITELQPGKYQLECQFIGYEKRMTNDLEVKSNEISMVDFTLIQEKLDSNVQIIEPSTIEGKSENKPKSIDPNISVGDADNKMDPNITIAEADNSSDPNITIKGTESIPFGDTLSTKIQNPDLTPSKQENPEKK